MFCTRKGEITMKNRNYVTKILVILVLLISMGFMDVTTTLECKAQDYTSAQRQVEGSNGNNEKSSTSKKNKKKTDKKAKGKSAAKNSEEKKEEEDTFTWDGPVLNSFDGIVPSDQTPSGYKETYYNLEMKYVIENMRNLGYSEEDYPYWIRDDGVKMFGDYVCVALIAEKGEIVPTTRGMGMVVDYCPEGTLDVAVTW